MITPDTPRRRFLGQATAALAATRIGAGMSLGGTRASASATPEPVVDRHSPAAAAGTLRIGGDLEVARLGFGGRFYNH